LVADTKWLKQSHQNQYFTVSNDTITVEKIILVGCLGLI